MFDVLQPARDNSRRSRDTVGDIASLAEQIRNELGWSRLPPDELAQLFEEASLGQIWEADDSLADALVRLYARVVDAVPTGARIELTDRLIQRSVVSHGGPAVLLPITCGDTDQTVVSRSAAAIVMFGPLDATGGPRGLRTLDRLLMGRCVRNPGAVLGGIAGLGDGTTHSVLHSWARALSPAALREAVGSASEVAWEGSINFWLHYAEQNQSQPCAEAVARLGIAADVLAALGRRAAQGVFTVERRYPVHRPPGLMRVTRLASRRHYASGIADRLWRLERAPAAPGMLAFVSRAWELAPRSTAGDQWGRG